MNRFLQIFATRLPWVALSFAGLAIVFNSWWEVFVALAVLATAAWGYANQK